MRDTLFMASTFMIRDATRTLHSRHGVGRTKPAMDTCSLAAIPRDLFAADP